MHEAPTYGSLFSGAGLMDLGLDQAGWTAAWQCEVDPVARRILRRHWPGVPLYDDIRTLDPARLAPIDLLVGGVPCQDVSVAGNRAGLAGERSGLFFDFARLADALAPQWLLMEEVPGLFTSGPTKGADFAVVLAELSGYEPAIPEDGWENEGVCCGPKRGLAWAVLDAQWFGVPQRRRRVFLVGHSGDWAAPASVLFDASCLRGSAAEGGETWEDAAVGAGDGTAGGRGGGLAKCLTSSAERIDYETETFVTGFDMAQVTSAANYSNPRPGDPQPPLAATGQPFVATVSTLQGGGKRGHRLDAEGAGGGHLIVSPQPSPPATEEPMTPTPKQDTSS